MSRDLHGLRRRAGDLAAALEQVRAKERYQLAQVREARRQRTGQQNGQGRGDGGTK